MDQLVVASRPSLRVVCGTGALSRLHSELRRVDASRPLLLHGSSMAGATVTADVRDAVNPVASYDQVRAHTPVSSVLELAALVHDSGADALVALGGGSAVVTARAAAIVLAEGGDLARLSTSLLDDGSFQSPRLSKPKLPIVCVPTTPSTAYCKAGTAVTEPDQLPRYSLYDPKTRSACVVLDENALATAPTELVRNSAFNALVMAVEGMTTRRANTLADADLSYALRALVDGVRHLGAATIGDGVLTDLALASILAGCGTELAGGGLTAAISHTTGHHFGIHNGPLDAVLLPHVLYSHQMHCPSSLIRLARALRCAPADVPEHVTDLLNSIEAPRRLRDLGVPREKLELIAHESLLDFAIANAAYEADADALYSILRNAW